MFGDFDGERDESSGGTQRAGSLPRRSSTGGALLHVSRDYSTYGAFSVLARRMHAPSAPTRAHRALGAETFGLQAVSHTARSSMAVGNRSTVACGRPREGRAA